MEEELSSVVVRCDRELSNNSYSCAAFGEENRSLNV